ncbi:hypothetical protein GH714_021680 [Hevea brasiliensis]|uniref:TF-B3 domain-containing protein n=1 Tax=Hevea brasiliensis TaxID=3981 RepID=A0A6A6KWG7_HEVBR|nr:hypothetical protein GH714_021680 [Hevea brasiliensis]
MPRILDIDDNGCFDRMVAAIKLMEENILTAFVQQVRAKAKSKHYDRLAAPVPKKRKAHGEREDKKIIIKDSSFPTEDEESKLKEQKENIPITLMEPCGNESKMLLRQWKLESSSTYVLTSSWKRVLERNNKGSSRKFKQNDIVQLWSFRHNGELWLALLRLGMQVLLLAVVAVKGSMGMVQVQVIV